MRRIKFNTANGNTSSELAIMFDIETLAECALVRILDSTPAVLIVDGHEMHEKGLQLPLARRLESRVH